MSILSAETEALIKERAILTGQTPDELVKVAFRLAGLTLGPKPPRDNKLTREELLSRMQAISDRAASRPVLDDRPADEIIGYDEFGVPS